MRGQPSLLLRERIGMGALVEITRQYLGDGGPARPVDLARALEAPLAMLEDLIEDFVASGLLVRTAEPDGVMLARPPEQITVVDSLGAIREPPSSRGVEPPAVPTAVSATLRRRDDAVRDALGSMSLCALATSASDAGRALPSGRERAA